MVFKMRICIYIIAVLGCLYAYCGISSASQSRLGLINNYIVENDIGSAFNELKTLTEESKAWNRSTKANLAKTAIDLAAKFRLQEPDSFDICIVLYGIALNELKGDHATLDCQYLKGKAYYNRATLNLSFDNITDALIDLQKADNVIDRLKGADAIFLARDVQHGLARAYSEMGAYEIAIKHFKNALVIQKQFVKTQKGKDYSEYLKAMTLACELSISTNNAAYNDLLRLAKNNNSTYFKRFPPGATLELIYAIESTYDLGSYPKLKEYLISSLGKKWTQLYIDIMKNNDSQKAEAINVHWLNDFRYILNMLSRNNLKINISDAYTSFALSKNMMFDIVGCIDGVGDKKTLLEIMKIKNPLSKIYSELKDKVFIDVYKLEKADYVKLNSQDNEYVMYVLGVHPKPFIRFFNLGSSDNIEKILLPLINPSMEKGIPKTSYRKCRYLYDLIFSKINMIDGIKYKEIVCSPDGVFCRVPLEVALSRDDKYQIEKYPIYYINSARDFIRQKQKRISLQTINLFSNPNFDLTITDDDVKLVAKNLCGFWHDLYRPNFEQLPGTMQEAIRIKRIAQNSTTVVKEYSYNNASKKNLLKCSTSSILHIATHGFNYSSLVSHKATSRGISIKSSQNKKGKTVEKKDEKNLKKIFASQGIALAGANIRANSCAGFLTSYDILRAKKKFADLIVLSACDTGSGSMKSFRGNYGFGLSFLANKASAVIGSLWPVEDKITYQMMCEVYKNLFLHKSVIESVRRAKLHVIKEYSAKQKKC